MIMKMRKIPPRKVLFSGKIFTGDKRIPWAEAVLIQGDRIAAVGANREILDAAGSDVQKIDLGGRLVIPGFNDAHLHFGDGGTALLEIDLHECLSEAEMIAKLKAFASNLSAGEWITGGYWNHERWASGKLPSKEILDTAGIMQPLLLKRIDTHMALANSRALKLAGIGYNTLSPAGGEIVRDAAGNVTGILKDRAVDRVQEVIPPPSGESRKKALRAAMAHANRFGITSIQDNASALDLELYQELLEEGGLTVRINAWREPSVLRSFEEIGIKKGFGHPFLRLGAIKVFSDGALGAGSAWMHEPFEDDLENSGLAIYPYEELAALLAAIDAAGLQIIVHAIGDRANTRCLDALEEIRKKRGGSLSSRHRIEHAQIVKVEDLSRFSRLGVVASIQPSHCIDDMAWAERKLGARISDAYRCRSLMDHGIPVAFGSDWPVESLNPLLAVYAAVTREFPEGGPAGGWRPGEKISLEAAISAHTSGSAYAEFQERDKGMIRPGMLADLAVLDRDIFTIPSHDILKTKTDIALISGEIAFTRED